MKKKLLLIAGVLFCLFTFAQSVNIPDPLFKSYLVHNSLINTNNDSEIQVSEATAFAGTINCPYLLITSMTGIEAFVNVKILICHSTQIASLDISKNTALTYLDCSSSRLTSLVSSNTALTELYCSDNKLTNLDISKNTSLNILNCNYNQLTSLDVSKNTALKELIFFHNQVTSLDLSKNTTLTYLDCRQNRLTSLDVSKNTVLTYLDSYENQLTSLDLSKNIALTTLDCSFNKLTRLNIKNGKNTLIISSNYQDFSNNYMTNLTCIQVDNVAYSAANWTKKDPQASYSTNCNYMSVKDVENSTVSLYPNPVKDIFHIQSKNEKIESAAIYDISGKMLLTSKETDAINVSHFSKGVYLVEVIMGKGRETYKMIKN